jgi:hypothetical protein
MAMMLELKLNIELPEVTALKFQLAGVGSKPVIFSVPVPFKTKNDIAPMLPFVKVNEARSNE